MTPFELSVMFFLQMAFILAVCRATAWAFMKIGQSRVVSEMIAGVLMGPSLMGWMFPEFSAYLFPAESKAILFSVAQLGLVLYMFLIGVEFDVDLIRKRVRSAASISIAGLKASPVLLVVASAATVAMITAIELDTNTSPMCCHINTDIGSCK